MSTASNKFKSNQGRIAFWLLGTSCSLAAQEAVGQASAGNAAAPLALQVADGRESDAAIPIVMISGHYDNSIGSSDAASEGVILGGLLQDRPFLRPGEVLETVPGLVVTQHSGDGKANQYFLRGYNLDHGTDLASSVENVPVNMPTNAHGQGYSDLNFLLPELVDHIDYRKGTYYADHGDFSAAGSDDIHYRDTLDQTVLNVTAGTFGYQRSVLAGSTVMTVPDRSAVAGTSDVRLLGALELEKYNGPWAVPEGLRKINGLLKLSAGTPGQGWSVDTITYQAHWDSTDQVPLALIRSGQLNRYGALDPSDGGDTARDILSGEWHQRDANGYMRITAFVEHYRLQLWSDFTFYELRPATGDQFSQVESRNILGGSAVKGWNHALFGADSVSEIGLQVRQDYNHVQLLDTDKRVMFNVVSDELINEAEAGLYAQNSTVWNNWFRTVTGVRLDQIYMHADSQNIAQNTGSESGNRISPKLAMVFGPWNKTELFLDAGSGFHSNDARGVIDKVDPTTLLAATPVPALVGAVGEEVGLRTMLTPDLRSSISFWRLNSSSEIIYNADSDIGSTTPNGASRRSGVEWNNSAAINSWLYVDTNLAWTHARFASNNDNREQGDYIPNSVSKVGSLGVAVHDLGPWSGELNTRYIGPYPLSQDGTLIGPSATVTNLRIQRSLTTNVAVSLDILNLFDRQYFDIAYEQDYKVTPGSPVVPTGVTVHPGEPREFRLTLRIYI